MGMVIGSTTGNTREVGVAIKNALGDRIDEIFDVESKKLAELTGYDVLLVGIPTWDIGQLQEDWIFALKQFEGLDFEGTKVAFFGDGDQVNYPYNFQDAMGILRKRFLNCGATADIGHWPIYDYEFESSEALVDNQFVGLALDYMEQSEYTAERVQTWCAQLLDELEAA
ncbi:MAG: flavodoxin [Pseudomonadota bacterium]